MWKTLRIGALDINGNSHDEIMMMMMMMMMMIRNLEQVGIQVHGCSM